MDDDLVDNGSADNVYFPTSNPEASRDMVTLLQGANMMRAANHALKNKALWNYLATADNSKQPGDYALLNNDVVVNYDYE